MTNTNYLGYQVNGCTKVLLTTHHGRYCKNHTITGIEH